MAGSMADNKEGKGIGEFMKRNNRYDNSNGVKKLLTMLEKNSI